MAMTKFKAGLFCALTLASGATQASRSAGCEVDFNKTQLLTMQRAWQFGKPHEMGYILAAISWQESQAGMLLTNNTKGAYKDVVVGPYHNKIRSVGNREGCDKKDRACYTGVAIKLLSDQTYASNHAIAEMYYWLGIRKNNMKAAIASYHGGYSYDSRASQNYAKTILKKVNYLKTCVAFRHFEITPLDDQVNDKKLVANSIKQLKRVR